MADGTDNLGGSFIFGKGKGQGSEAIKSFDLGKSASAVLGLIPILQQLVGPESRLRQAYQGANIAEAGSFLQGLPGLARQAGRAASQELARSRMQDLRGMGRGVGLARGILAGLSPEAAQQLQQATQASQEAYQRASQYGMSPEEQRSVQQQSREAYGARGMLGSTGSVASEILNRDIYQQQRQAALRGEAAQAGQRAFVLGQQMYSQPGLELLAQAPASAGMAQNYLTAGLGAIGKGSPQLLDPGLGINLRMAQLNSLLGLESAYMAKNAQERAANMGLLGDLAKSASNMFSPIKFPGFGG